MLDKIYAEQRATNRNLLRISNIILMVTLAILKKDAEACNDERRSRLCRMGMGLLEVSQGILIATDVVEIAKAGKSI